MRYQRSTKIFHFVAFIFLGYTLAGCSSGPNIMSDHDRSADFGSYHTYNFMEGAGPENSSYQSFFSQYMMDAITVEMDKRGYAKSDNPDLLLNFNAVLSDKTDVRTTSSPAMHGGGYYGYRGASYGAWGGYGYGTETHVSQYTEGTINIDIIDAKKHQLVWEAVGVGKVSDEALANLEERVKLGVPKYFSLYPYRAGNPNPVAAE